MFLAVSDLIRIRLWPVVDWKVKYPSHSKAGFVVYFSMPAFRDVSLLLYSSLSSEGS